MPNQDDQSKSNIIPELLTILLGLPWPEIIGDLWRLGRKTMRGLSSEGMYEVLDYEATLELQNQKGTRAKFSETIASLLPAGQYHHIPGFRLRRWRDPAELSFQSRSAGRSLSLWLQNVYPSLTAGDQESRRH